MRQARAYDIPALPVASAISTFNRQSGIQVSLPAGAGANVTTRPIRGNYTAAEALRLMLEGTGVTYSFGQAGEAILNSEGAAAGGDGTALDPIVLRRGRLGRGYQGTPDEVYETPAAVSIVTRQAIENTPAARSAADVLDTVSGLITNRAEGQKPGIAINLRGLQDMGRVTTSIDGARQNFQRSGHGGYQQILVDTAFIREIDIEKGGVDGVGGAGSLGGAVDFRTVSADDLLEDGKNFGGEVQTETGTNAYDFVGSAVGAIRFSDTFSLVGGVAKRKIGDYDVGRRGRPDDLPDQTVVDDSVLFSSRETLNTLLKAEWDITDDLSFTGSWMHYKGDGATGGNGLRTNDQGYLNDTFTATFEFDPESELIDARLKLWYNDTSNDESREYVDIDTGSSYFEDYSYGMKSFGGSLENTSWFNLPVGELAWHYGVEAYQDNGETESLTPPAVDQGFDGGWGLVGANAPGKRWVASAFTSATLQHEDWLTLTGGLRYDHYRLWGSTLVQNRRTVNNPPSNCQQWADIDSDGTPDTNGIYINETTGVIIDGGQPNPGPGFLYIPAECWSWGDPGGPAQVIDAIPVDVDQSDGAWLPSATIAVKPVEWLQPFVSYSRSYRPPAVFEALLSGGHPGLPFENAPYPYLRPERGETWELGVNIAQDGIFTSGDAFRMKAVYFRRDIKDYISQGYNYYDPIGRDQSYIMSVNLDGTTKMRGLEIEANYDAGSFYVGGSYTYIDTDWADSYTPIQNPDAGGIDSTPDPTILYLPPREKLTIDAGVRLFDERLVLGARLNHVSETATGFGQLSGYTNATYTTYDLYGSFDVTPQAKLRFGISNLTDEFYVPSLGIESYPAPGRTYTASLKMRF
ncbi:TonB-dependent receptor [Rhizobium sp. NFR07]|uniref:TonB-dependent receptor n=1 Tax=Rhizobium sp. NFR07 TaxID=1566262 RepID=UPI0015A57F67|nr:TonB-dependent receptor [Rhizobium sp. NFR07]